MEMPKPGDAHARLHALAGRWGGEETVHPAPWDPAGGAATAFISNRIALGGFAVVQEYEQYREGKPTFSGHGLFWWDDAANEYVMTWFDSMMGRPSDFRGAFDGDVLRLTQAMPQGGFSRCTFDCGLPGEYVFVMEVSDDGQTWTPALEGAYGLLNGAAPRARKGRGGRKPAPKRASATKPAAKKASARKTSARKGAAKRGAAKRAAAGKAAPATARARPGAPRTAAQKAARGKK
jgi:hypothetical protein